MNDFMHNHKAIHYERCMAIDDMLFRDTTVYEVEDMRHPTKNPEVFTFTLPNIFAQIHESYNWRQDFPDSLKSDKIFPQIPPAFKYNRTLLIYTAIRMELIRTEGSITKMTVDYEKLKEMLHVKTPDDEMIISTIINEMWHMYNFWIHHERIYKISTGLLDSLMKTDYPALTDMVRSPNPEFFLLFPISNDIKLPGTNSPIEGAYVNFQRIENEGRSLLSCYLTERPRTLKEVEEPTSYYFTFPMDDGVKLNDAIENEIEKMRPQTFNDWELVKLGKFDIKKELKPIVQLVINSLLYMTSVNADIIQRPAPKEIKATNKRIRKMPHRVKSRKNYFQLGSDIIIRGNDGETAITGGTGHGTSHSYRYLVRGHFGHYWMKNLTERIKPSMITDIKEGEFGEKLYRVRKWIKPHWRGQEMADVVLRDYKLKE